MDFHNHFAFGAVDERDRLDVRINHRPLTCPVAAHFVASVDMTAFHAVCPNDILVHGCEHRLHVTSVEAVVNTFKEVHFVRHSNLASSWPTLAQTPFSYTFLSPLKISDLCFHSSGATTFSWATEGIVGNSSPIRLSPVCPSSANKRCRVRRSLPTKPTSGY